MGGYGSGSRNRYASKVDEFHKLDLATFEREWFERCRSGTVSWSRGGHPMGSIGYSLAPDHMRLDYSVTRQGEKVSISERFDLASTEQPFGGRRWWIVCRSCQRRCRVLYGGTYFRCRRCCHATYPSQYDFIRLPGIGRIDRIRDKLGGDPGLLNPFPRKPKGMHWRAYRRLEACDREASERLERMLYTRFNRARAGRSFRL